MPSIYKDNGFKSLDISGSILEDFNTNNRHGYVSEDSTEIKRFIESEYYLYYLFYSFL